MQFQWKIIETRSDALQNRLNELQASGHEIVKIDMLFYSDQLQIAKYLIIARQAITAPPAEAYSAF